MTEQNGIHDAGARRQQAAQLPQSGHGIASFVIALVSAVAIIAGVLSAALVVASGDVNQQVGVIGVIGLILCTFLLLSLVGLVLGFIALRKQDRRRTFGAIGLGINAFLLIGTAGLVLLGTFVSHSNS